MPAIFSLPDEIKKLEEIEGYFQQPNMNLDEAIKKHQEALAVAKKVLSYLEKAESTIQQLDLRSMLSESEATEEVIIS